MNKIRKAMKFAALSLVAAASLLALRATPAWASVEGFWLHNIFGVQGPTYLFKSRVGGAQGLVISTAPYSGASQSGVPNAVSSTLWFIGSQTTAARTACAAGIEGQFMYDTTIHSIAFCDGTAWHKLVAGTSANDTWTSY